MRILLLKTPITNIGNGFINKGAKALIERSISESTVVESSGFSNAIIDKQLMTTVRRKLGDSLDTCLSHSRRKNISTIYDLVDVDVVVLPGCVLTEGVLRKHLPVLREATEADIPIFLLGVGAGSYSDATMNAVNQCLEKLNTHGFISRNPRAFETYEANFENTHNGIDCAYFIDDWYTPPESDEVFDSFTFDKTREPQIETNNPVIRPHHAPFGRVHMRLPMKIIRGILGQLKPYDEAFDDESIFMSDDLKEYLFIYANASETHSDRVHACIPSLVYGNKARFYYETPRGGLFNKVLDSDISETLVEIDQEKLDDLKREQCDQFEKFVRASI